MGRVKHFMMEEEVRGFYSVGDKYLCSGCVGEKDLALYVRKNGHRGECTYCGNKLRNVVHFDLMMERLIASIFQEYGDPNNVGVAWDRGWCGDVFDSYDLLDRIGIPFESMVLQDDVLTSLEGKEWCKQDFYQLSPSQAYIFGWKKFVDLVKHKSRYSFYRTIEENEYGGYEEIPAQYFMDSLSGIVDSLNLYKTLPVNSSVIRVRIHARKEKWNTAKQLGSPPLECSTYANRMSPSGISMFYGAFDRRTAIAETYEITNEDKVATVGTFELTRDLKFIDFSELPNQEGFFSGVERSYRHKLAFIYEFLDDLTAPVSKDGLEHIEARS
ncbi:HEPN-associated N-terminal domain-containing protein [Aliivibrio salmonicida]|uniref:HEPN-associated N-terminal domain-containing protein n=1 Tax=Aliivibrio salmonicida TaxID=40269 RepID=UPI00406D309B